MTGRELLLPEEVRMLDNRYALLFIRGERPVQDLKYDIMKHPAIRKTEDGGLLPYIHGEALDAAFTIGLVWDTEDEAPDIIEIPETSYELLSEEDVQEEVKKNEEKEQEN